MFMKKIILILALFGCSLAFAQINGEPTPKDKVIYCPTKITCDNTAKECTFISVDAKYFGKLSILKNDGTPLFTSYPYKSTTASFHSHDTEAYCNYGNLNLEIKAASNLEAYRIEGSSWSGKSPTETCLGNCPLHENMGFVIINSISPEGIYASIAQQDINKLITKNSRIIFEDILLQCGGLKVCVIDFLSAHREMYGNIFVDMETMKTLQVTSLDPTIKINKIDGLNAVEINRIDAKKEKKAIYCPPVLKCNFTNDCTFASLDAKYFGKIDASKTTPGATLTFYSANVDHGFQVSCTYRRDGDYHTATLSINHEYHLDSYSSKSDSKWFNSGTLCMISPESCPFKNRFDIWIRNININSGLYASIGNTYISRLFYGDAFDMISIDHSDALLGCGEKTECSINLLSSQQAQYGSVTIDTKTMRILKVDSLYPNYIKLAKVSGDGEFSDTVDVSYVTALKFIPENLR